MCGADGPVNPYEEVALGRTGLRVSRIGMGTGMRGWMRESNQTRLGREALEALLRGAWERGVRFSMCEGRYTSDKISREVRSCDTS